MKETLKESEASSIRPAWTAPALAFFSRLARSAGVGPESGALIAAAKRGDARMVRARACASEAARCDDWGYTALMWAAANGREECVKALLPWSDARSGNKNGFTPLMAAIAYQNNGCARLLAPHSDLRAADDSGATALILAAHQKDLEMVEMVLAGSDLLARDKKGRSALAVALHRRCWPVARRLMERSMELNLGVKESPVDELGRDALMLAALSGSDQMVSFLLSNAGRLGVDPLRVDREGFSALMRAADDESQAGEPRSAWLLPHSDPTQVSAEGRDAEALARARGRTELADRLGAAALAIREGRVLEALARPGARAAARPSVRI